MLFAIAAGLVVLWILGLVRSKTSDGYIHLFLVTAIVVLIAGVLQGPASYIFLGLK